MKILHYVDENKLAWGETWIQLIKELTAQGTENFVVCRPGGILASRLKEEGLNFDTAAPLIQAFPFTNHKFGKIIRRENPDIIHTRLSSAARIGGWWGRRVGIPVVETIDKYPKLKYYRDASFIFPCSTAVMKHMVDIGFPVEKCVVVYNPVDISRYKRDDSIRKKLRQKHNVSENTKIILGAGRFVDWKGFEYLIAAYAELLQSGVPIGTCLWLVGDGPEMSKYRALVDKFNLGEKVAFHGFARDIRPWLWASDIFVQPSQEPEGFSLMLLEAMSSGLPSIATNIGGTLDIIEDRVNGWLMNTGKYSGLAEKLRSVLEDEAALNVVACKAMESASKFNVHNIAAETIKLYENVIKYSLDECNR